jgi:hypothetical protein
MCPIVPIVVQNINLVYFSYAFPRIADAIKVFPFYFPDYHFASTHPMLFDFLIRKARLPILLMKPFSASSICNSTYQKNCSFFIPLRQWNTSETFVS